MGKLYYTYEVDGEKLKTPETLTTEKQLRDHFGDRITNLNLTYLLETEDEIEKLCRYKVIWGYDKSKITRITELDLEIAVYAWGSGVKVNIGEDLITGSQIIAIQEDFSTEMGWHPTYDLKDADWAEIRELKLDEKYLGKLKEAKEKVKYMIDNNKIELIGKNIPIKDLYAGNYKLIN